MNIQLARDAISEFLITRVRIDSLDIDYPDQLYSSSNNQIIPANVLLKLPIQSLTQIKSSTNSIKTTALCPYRLTYRFPSDMPYHDLPMKALEGMLEYINIIILLGNIDPAIESVIPARIEDSLTVEKASELQSDWLVHINFAFNIAFTNTTLPDISDLQPGDFFDFGNPPTIQEITIKVNRAKAGFNNLDSATFTEDSEIIINK